MKRFDYNFNQNKISLDLGQGTLSAGTMITPRFTGYYPYPERHRPKNGEHSILSNAKSITVEHSTLSNAKSITVEHWMSRCVGIDTNILLESNKNGETFEKRLKLTLKRKMEFTNVFPKIIFDVINQNFKLCISETVLSEYKNRVNKTIEGILGNKDNEVSDERLKNFWDEFDNFFNKEKLFKMVITSDSSKKKKNEHKFQITKDFNDTSIALEYIYSDIKISYIWTKNVKDFMKYQNQISLIKDIDKVQFILSAIWGGKPSLSHFIAKEVYKSVGSGLWSNEIFNFMKETFGSMMVDMKILNNLLILTPFHVNYVWHSKVGMNIKLPIAVKLSDNNYEIVEIIFICRFDDKINIKKFEDNLNLKLNIQTNIISMYVVKTKSTFECFQYGMIVLKEYNEVYKGDLTLNTHHVNIVGEIIINGIKLKNKDEFEKKFLLPIRRCVKRGWLPVNFELGEQ